MRSEACSLLQGKKERRRYSVNRSFFGDYINLEANPMLRRLLNDKRERVEFADLVTKYDRRGKGCKRELMLSAKFLYLVGREKVKQGPNKGQIVPAIIRKIPLQNISQVSASTRQDDLVVIHVTSEFSSVIETPFKTELLVTLFKRYHNLMNKNLVLDFSDVVNFTVKKGGQKTIKFTEGRGNVMQLRSAVGGLAVSIGPGVSKDARPGQRERVDRSLVPANIQVVASGQRRTSAAPPGGGRRQPGYGHQAPPAQRPPAQMQYHHTAPGMLYTEVNKRVGQNNVGGQRRDGGAARGPPTRAPPPPPSGVATGLPRKHPGQTSAPVNKRPPAGPPVASKTQPRLPNFPKCRALYDYSATDADELSFQEGNIIDIIKEDVSGWWRGELRGKRGLFPSNYVKKI